MLVEKEIFQNAVGVFAFFVLLESVRHTGNDLRMLWDQNRLVTLLISLQYIAL